MIHKHILTALHRALNFYLDPQNENEVLDILDSTSIGISSITRTLAKLRNEPPVLRVHADAGSASLPLVVSQILSRRVTERPLGHTFNENETVISKQDAKLEVFARTEEETELLADLCLKGLQQSRTDFLKNGYLFFSLEGLEEITPQEQMTAEELGFYLRRLSISAMIQEDVSRIIPEPTLGTLTIGLKPQGLVDFFSSSL